MIKGNEYTLTIRFMDKYEDLIYFIPDSEINLKGIVDILLEYVENYLDVFYGLKEVDYDIIDYRILSSYNLVKELKSLMNMYGCKSKENEYIEKRFNNIPGLHMDNIINKYKSVIKTYKTDYISNGDCYKCHLVSFVDKNDELYIIPIELNYC